MKSAEIFGGLSQGCKGLSQTGQSFLGCTQLIELRVFPLEGTLLGSDSNHLAAQHLHVKKNL